jgi:DNA-binding NarL/FixJ family response regulator
MDSLPNLLQARPAEVVALSPRRRSLRATSRAELLATGRRGESIRRESRALRARSRAAASASKRLRARVRSDRRERAARFEDTAATAIVLRGLGSTRLDGPALTPRQQEILQLIADGRDTTAMAQRLRLSPATIRNHVAALLHALGAHTRIEALAVARERRLI